MHAVSADTEPCPFCLLIIGTIKPLMALKTLQIKINQKRQEVIYHLLGRFQNLSLECTCLKVVSYSNEMVFLDRF